MTERKFGGTVRLMVGYNQEAPTYVQSRVVLCDDLSDIDLEAEVKLMIERIRADMAYMKKQSA